MKRRPKHEETALAWWTYLVGGMVMHTGINTRGKTSYYLVVSHFPCLFTPFLFLLHDSLVESVLFQRPDLSGSISMRIPSGATSNSRVINQHMTTFIPIALNPPSDMLKRKSPSLLSYRSLLITSRWTDHSCWGTDAGLFSWRNDCHQVHLLFECLVIQVASFFMIYV